MESDNGPTVHYELVYKFFAVQLHKLKGGYMVSNGESRGILVKSSGMGEDMYHKPEDYLRWKHEMK